MSRLASKQKSRSLWSPGSPLAVLMSVPNSEEPLNLKVQKSFSNTTSTGNKLIHNYSHEFAWTSSALIESARLLKLCFRPYTLVRFSKNQDLLKCEAQAQPPKSMNAASLFLGRCSPGGPNLSPLPRIICLWIGGRLFGRWLFWLWIRLSNISPE